MTLIPGRVHCLPQLRSHNTPCCVSHKEHATDYRLLGVPLHIRRDHTIGYKHQGTRACRQPCCDHVSPLGRFREAKKKDAADKGNNGHEESPEGAHIAGPPHSQGGDPDGDDLNGAGREANEHGLELVEPESIDDERRELVSPPVRSA